MGHFVVRDDATGIGIGKITHDHHDERELPDQLFARVIAHMRHFAASAHSPC